MGQKKSGWERFFDEHASRYMDNVFVTNTLVEVDFLLEQLAIPPGGTILDIGCGTGRHSVELARRGYQVTGVDLSAGMLAKAEEAAEEAGVNVRWIRQDATQFVCRHLSVRGRFFLVEPGRRSRRT